MIQACILRMEAVRVGIGRPSVTTCISVTAPSSRSARRPWLPCGAPSDRRIGNRRQASSTGRMDNRAQLQDLTDRESVKGSSLDAVWPGKCASSTTSWLEVIPGRLQAALVQLHGAVSDLNATLSESLALLDCLDRLALSALFKREIDQFLHLLYRQCWSGSATTTGIATLLDTSLAFRFLREHGYHVSPDVFEKFRKPNEDLLSRDDSVATVLNFYRASQRAYLGETLLEDGRLQALRLLKERQAENDCWDGTISKDLSREVDLELYRPWKSSIWRSTQRRSIEEFVPRPAHVVNRQYLQLGLSLIDEQGILDLAKANFNSEQAKHQEEVQRLERWYVGCKLDKINVGNRGMVTESYYGGLGLGIQADLWESLAACAQNTVLLTLSDDYFDLKLESFSDLQTFVEAIRRWDPSLVQNGSDLQQILFFAIYDTVNSMSEAASSPQFQGRDVGRHLRRSYVRVLEAMLTEAEWNEKAYIPSLPEYLKAAEPSFALEPLLLSMLLFMPKKLSDDILDGSDYLLHLQLVSRSGRLVNDLRSARREREMGKFNSVTIWMGQNPSLTVEETEEQLLQKAEDATTQLMRLVFTHGDSANCLHPEGRRIFLGMCCEVNCMYYSTDEWSKPESELKGMIKDMIFRSIP